MNRSFTSTVLICLLACCAALWPLQLCAGQSARPSVAERLSASWLADAKNIRTAQLVVFYRGEANGSYSPDAKTWTGEIRGEVLVLGEHSVQACREIQFLPEGSIKVKGPSSTTSEGSGLSAEQIATWHKLFTNK